MILSFLYFTDVSELKDLVNTAEQSQFPDCDLFQQLKAAVTEAERCASVALQLVSRKHRTRPHGGADAVPVTRLSLDELQGFMQQLQNLPCVVREAELVQVSIEFLSKTVLLSIAA